MTRPPDEINLNLQQRLVEFKQRRSELDITPSTVVIPIAVLKRVMGQILELEAQAEGQLQLLDEE